MHLLASKPGGFVDDEGIVDLAQTAADLVVLSAADSSLAALAQAVDSLPENFPTVRLANWMQLVKPAAYDLYESKVLQQDRPQVVLLSLLGGESYWPYGFDRLQQWAREKTGKRHLIIVPGDHEPDQHLFGAGSVEPDFAREVWQYLREGGSENGRQLFCYLATHMLEKEFAYQPPRRLPHCMIYQPGLRAPALLSEWQQRWQAKGIAAQSISILLFYRSHFVSSNTGVFDALIDVFEAAGLCLLPVAIISLKEHESIQQLNHLVESQPVSLIINSTGFSCNRASDNGLSGAINRWQSPINASLPVLQLLMSSSTEEDWRQTAQGLRSRDIATQIVLPEMDGRIITHAIGFKAHAEHNDRCQLDIIRYQLNRERAQVVAQIAKKYLALAAKPNHQKKVALILANYPTKDGRIGNGVGLDTPASAVAILQAMAKSGFPVESYPTTGNLLLEQLLGTITNNPNTLHTKGCWQSISIADYLRYFHQLPADSQQQILQRWGDPAQDPKCRNGRIMIAGRRCGDTFIGIQPARGFDQDLLATYHDPDLVPPHNYLAFYFWLRHEFKVDAIIHIGKHGNLEWLPGKGTALSECCWPSAILGPLPHFYPFIVNDPGEGSQAKRRTHGVIVDHLMPPMTRAETYGALATLEGLVDEYYQAMDLDPRRSQWLRTQIVAEVKVQHVWEELSGTGINKDWNEDELLAQLDAYLCDIKEAQIRHGLHRLGALPATEKLADTIVALLRLPRGSDDQDQGLLHGLAADFGFNEFNPLANDTTPWTQAKPEALMKIVDGAWRTAADTRERLELYARELVLEHVIKFADQSVPPALCATLPATCAVIRYAKEKLWPALQKSAELELHSIITGLEGQFVPPGPSGAPTRGRLDTLPTGRNFFSLDNRAIPTAAAWALGQQSAQKLIERHLQEQGEYPQQVGLSVWGTATMRTGGDDIAQAFALMGIRPVWAAGSQRVVDIEIIPAMQLGRPRVDVTLRVSGFFRDAFPNVMKLFDAAVLLLAELEEPGEDNIVREHIALRAQTLMAQGVAPDKAKREASYRVFGSKPGAYGAGLQGLIDERCWESSANLAEAYSNWGGYAYGQDAAAGTPAHASFQYRLSQLDTVIQNQDNREHDLLDSDDYYQFQGGMSNAVNVFSGQAPAVYHGDHSNPSAPKIRTLKEELNRVIRSRVLNPKWISAMREHGYKGAFEMAASVDYLFAYSATTQLIDDYQFEQVSDALIFDKCNQQFLRENNLNALQEMSERMLEAIQRGLWQDSKAYGERLSDLLLDLDDQLETQTH